MRQISFFIHENPGNSCVNKSFGQSINYNYQSPGYSKRTLAERGLLPRRKPVPILREVGMRFQ